MCPRVMRRLDDAITRSVLVAARSRYIGLRGRRTDAHAAPAGRIACREAVFRSLIDLDVAVAGGRFPVRGTIRRCPAPHPRLIFRRTAAARTTALLWASSCAALVFFRPRGQIRSTRMRFPSAREAGSYARLICSLSAGVVIARCAMMGSVSDVRAVVAGTFVGGGGTGVSLAMLANRTSFAA
jgi:hypothetical protein